MTVAGIGATTSPTNMLYDSDSTTMGKDDFLTLLVTQLQNQDPLNPAESTEFVSQLAQFSALEQMSNVNENLKIIQLFEQSINNAQAMNFIGKTVRANGSMFEVEFNESHDIKFQLAEDAAAVHIKIYDNLGEFITELEPGEMAAGEHTVTWDGTDENDTPVSPGTYSFTVEAENEDGETMPTAAYIEEEITGVSYHDGNTYLMAGDIEIPYSAVMAVEEMEEGEEGGGGESGWVDSTAESDSGSNSETGEPVTWQ